MARDGGLIVRRVKKVQGDGHHGGQWKVAYADFVTAMMAFFLLMWLINTTTPEQKRGIADYFAAQSISRSSSGSGGILGGRTFGSDSARASGAVAVNNQMTPPRPADNSRSQDSANVRGGAESDGQASDSQPNSDDHLERALTTLEDRRFEQAELSLRQAMQDMPDVAELSRHILLDQTPEGMRIQLVDQDGRAMFAAGSAEPLGHTRRLLVTIARVIAELPNRISISGHTDGGAFRGPDGETNWELSAARANACRAVLESAGVDNDRIYQVAGKAGSEPLLPDDPYASANRRISVVLLREAPVVPPGHSL